MRQHGEARHVAGRIHPRNRSAHLRVHLDAERTSRRIQREFHAHILKADTVHHSPAPHRDQDAVSRDAGLRAIGRLEDHLVALDGRHPAAQMEADALLFILGLQHRADFPVHGAEDLGHHLHHRHLRAQRIEEAGELHADNPAADDNQALGLFRKKKDFAAGHDRGTQPFAETRDRRNDRLGACADQHV